jgi:hypothetical protein
MARSHKRCPQCTLPADECLCALDFAGDDMLAGDEVPHADAALYAGDDARD